jgi:hypothetical protein
MGRTSDIITSRRPERSELLLLPRLGYRWLGSAFDGFGAITGKSQPSHF